MLLLRMPARCRAIRGSLLAGALLLALFAVSATDAAACATCVSATECDIDVCDGAMTCTFDGPLVETETETECSLVTRLIFGCRVYYGHRLPSCRPSGGPCSSLLPQCDTSSDLDPEIRGPGDADGDDEPGDRVAVAVEMSRVA